MRKSERLTTWLASFSLLVTASCGGSSISAVKTPDGSEPQFVVGVSHEVFVDDFASYTDGPSFNTAPGGQNWALSGPLAQLSAPASSGPNGTGRSAQLVWHIGDGWLILDHGVASQSSRVAYVSYDYKAPNFIYGTVFPQEGKKHVLLNNGETQRITIAFGMGVDNYAGAQSMGIEMTETNGNYLFTHPDQMPWGDQNGTVVHVTDGNWHHITVKRTAESANGARDGAIELWMDGQKLFNLQNAGTGTQGIDNITLAGTFNGGSPREQTEYYDNIRIWY